VKLSLAAGVLGNVGGGWFGGGGGGVGLVGHGKGKASHLRAVIKERVWKKKYGALRD